MIRTRGTSEFIGTTEVNDGFNGDKVFLYYVKDDTNNTILAVHSHGYFRVVK